MCAKCNKQMQNFIVVVVVNVEDVENAWVDVGAGEVLEKVRARQTVQARLDDLTERERDVMRLVIEGLPNKLIADQLDISVRTVEVHRARVFEKMNVRSAVELANLVRSLG